MDDTSLHEVDIGEQLSAAILALLAQRDPGKTICPSDAARAVGGSDFCALMGPTREAAARLVAEGRIEVTQKGEPVRIETARGPIRLRLAGNPVDAAGP